MSYLINLTQNGTLLTTIPDGTVNGHTGLTLVGRNYPNYGQIQNENFIKLLENFADTVNPTLSSATTIPLTGMLWYDSGTQKLRVYDGTNWNTVSERIVSPTAPATNTNTIKTGDQWYDTTNNQLNSWTGTAWVLIGPSFTSTQGKTGPQTESITDTNGQTHTVVNTYTNGNLISVTSFDNSFTPATGYTGFGTIVPGINLLSNAIVNGNVTNSATLSGIAPGSFARVDQSSNFTNSIGVVGNITLGSVTGAYANVHFSGSNNLVLHNWAYQGNVNFYVNSSLGNITTLHIDGTTGLGTVYGDPTVNLGIATKQYVDNSITAQVQDIYNIKDNLLTDVAALSSDYLANVGVINGAIANTTANATANLNAVHSQIDSNVAALTTAVGIFEAAAVANAASIQSNVNSLIYGLYGNDGTSGIIATLAPTNSPVFTGNPLVPSVPNLLAYNAAIGALDVQVTFNQALSINSGSYIVQIDPTTGQTLANLVCLSTINGAYTTDFATVSGQVSTWSNTVTFLNDGLQSGLHANAVTTVGRSFAFSALGDSSTSAASTLYVDATANLIYADYTTKLASLSSTLSGNINDLLTYKANIASPQLTGYPTAPDPAALTWSTNGHTFTGGGTLPGTGSRSYIATTDFVEQSISAQKFNYTVSASAPSGGNDGDFWFQTVS